MGWGNFARGNFGRGGVSGADPCLILGYNSAFLPIITDYETWGGGGGSIQVSPIFLVLPILKI